jgi:chromosome segregation ATPase
MKIEPTAIIFAGIAIVAIFSAISAAIAGWASRKSIRSDYAMQLRRENTTLKHMEWLLEESQKQIGTLLSENTELRAQLSEMQQEVAELKANIILLINAVEKLSAAEISEKALEKIKLSVGSIMDKNKPKPRKNEGA